MMFEDRDMSDCIRYRHVISPVRLYAMVVTKVSDPLQCVCSTVCLVTVACLTKEKIGIEKTPYISKYTLIYISLHIYIYWHMYVIS